MILPTTPSLSWKFCNGKHKIKQLSSDKFYSITADASTGLSVPTSFEQWYTEQRTHDKDWLLYITALRPPRGGGEREKISPNIYRSSQTLWCLVPGTRDNATDVLYLGSQSPLAFKCQILSDRVILTFSSGNQKAVEISLEGWVSDESTCGHLVVVSSGVQMSVDKLLEECPVQTGGNTMCSPVIISHSLITICGWGWCIIILIYSSCFTN